MADFETGRPGTDQSVAPSPTIVVCILDDGRREQLSDQLSGAGFRALPTATWSGALALLADNDVDVGLVDRAVGDYRTELPAAARLTGPRFSPDQVGEIPLIFLADDPTHVDWDAYAQLDRVEVITYAAASEQLIPQVGALVQRLRRQAGHHGESRRLRAAVRAITADLQNSDEPTVISERLVTGIAAAFDADYLHFVALDDAPVPAFAVQWDRASGEFGPLEIGRYRAPFRALAQRLWTTGVALESTDPDSPPPPPEEAELVELAKKLGARSSILIPVGDSTAPFGILFLADEGRQRRWSALEVSLLRELAGDVARALRQAQVIADQREVLRRLEILDRAKSEFLATVNHELRTPLTSLSAYVDLLLDGAGGVLPPRAAEMLSVVDRNARRLGSLVDDVLTISRITANEHEVSWAEVDVSALARRVVDSVRPAAAARGVELMTDLAPDLRVDGDVQQLEQVLTKLADNAVKFTGPGGRVEFQLSEDQSDSPPTVQVCVTDTGTGGGIAAAEVPELFTSFYRGANAQATAVAGSGLGLAIVSGLVAAHHGQVDVASTEVGGTSVCVHLPRTRSDAIGSLEEP